MGKTVEFLFDFGSPTTYLAHRRLPALGLEVTHVPVLLGGIFKATGNASPVLVPARGRYMGADMARHASKFDIPLTMNPWFPINTIVLMRMATAWLDEPRFMAFVDAVFDAMWATPRNLGDPAEVAAVLAAAGFDPAALLARADDPAVKERLKAATEAAVARGAFGCPTFFVGGEMFFGQDRLDWVADAAR